MADEYDGRYSELGRGSTFSLALVSSLEVCELTSRSTSAKSSLARLGIRDVPSAIAFALRLPLCLAYHQVDTCISLCLALYQVNPRYTPSLLPHRTCTQRVVMLCLTRRCFTETGKRIGLM